MKKSTTVILIILILILACGLGFTLYRVQKAADSEYIPEAGTSINADHSSEYITYQGSNYPCKRRMSTMLLIGTDNFVDDSKQNRTEAYYNSNFADFLAILIFDHDNKTVIPFQINRDTMASVPWLAVNGIVGGHTTEQITFAHTYGTGKEDSCENTVNAVRELIFNAPIDRYFAFTMDAVPVINDLVGGVTVTLEEDLPSLGSEFVAGATVTLKGQTALRYVRWRDTSETDSNLLRMSHQRQYLASFTEAAKAAASANQDLAVDAFRAIEKFLVTDMTVNAISEIVDNLCEYEILPVVTPSGNYVLGEKYAEFYVDEASLWACVREAFCR